MNELLAASSEKPENGKAGLKHLRHDVLAGIVVSLVSLPRSSGIAIASGCPPIVGLLSTAVGCCCRPFISIYRRGLLDHQRTGSRSGSRINGRDGFPGRSGRR